MPQLRERRDSGAEALLRRASRPICTRPGATRGRARHWSGGLPVPSWAKETAQGRSQHGGADTRTQRSLEAPCLQALSDRVSGTSRGRAHIGRLGNEGHPLKSSAPCAPAPQCGGARVRGAGLVLPRGGSHPPSRAAMPGRAVTGRFLWQSRSLLPSMVAPQVQMRSTLQLPQLPVACS